MNNINYSWSAYYTPDPGIQMRINVLHWSLQFKKDTPTLNKYTKTNYDCVKGYKQVPGAKTGTQTSKDKWWGWRKHSWDWGNMWKLRGETKTRVPSLKFTQEPCSQTQKEVWKPRMSSKQALHPRGKLVWVPLGPCKWLCQDLWGTATGKERLFCHLLTDWILSQRTNTSGHKLGAAQREESYR